MYTPHINTSKLANQPAQKTVSTCLVYSQLSMTFGSPSLLDMPQFFLKMLTPWLYYLIIQMFKVINQLTILLNQQVHIFVLSGIW